MKRIYSALAALALTLLAGQGVAEPRVVESIVLGPFSGHDAKFHPANLTPLRIEYYGTDLGFTYEHRGELRILFGDSWATEATRRSRNRRRDVTTTPSGPSISRNGPTRRALRRAISR